MKKFLPFLTAFFVTAALAQPATYTLISDPVDTRADWAEVEVDSVVDPNCVASPSGVGLETTCLALGAVSYDITASVNSGDPFSVRARVCRTGPIGPLCSAWSADVPFDFFTPTTAGLSGLRIVKD